MSMPPKVSYMTDIDCLEILYRFEFKNPAEVRDCVQNISPKAYDKGRPGLILKKLKKKSDPCNTLAKKDEKMEPATFEQRRALYNMYQAMRLPFSDPRFNAIHKMNKIEASVEIGRIKNLIQENGFPEKDKENADCY